MKYVITGGCGFIGVALVDFLSRDGSHKVRIVDNLSVGSLERLTQIGEVTELSLDGLNWSTPLEFVEADIRDRAAMVQAVKGADVVVHLAANTGVPKSVEDPFLDQETNVKGTLNVLDACRHAGVERFVFASSGAPVGEQTPPIHENMTPHPASPYGASKLAGEAYCSAYSQCFGVETVALRFGNVYGPGSGHKTSVVAKFLKNILSGEALEIYGDGTQTRDFIYLNDLLDAVLRAATQPGIGGEIFQIATAQETQVSELVDQMLATVTAAGLPVPEITYSERRKGDVLRNFSDTSKAQRMLGWQAQTSLTEGLALTLQSFIDSKPNLLEQL